LYLGAIFRLPSSFWLLRALAAFVVILPVTALIVSRVYLLFAYEFFSSTVYQAAKVSLWSSVALWEWIGALCIYLFLALTTLKGAPTQARKKP
jgi:uncharacterized membrane protein